MKMRKKKHLSKNPNDAMWAKMWRKYPAPEPLSVEKLSKILAGFAEDFKQSSQYKFLMSEDSKFKIYGGVYGK